MAETTLFPFGDETEWLVRHCKLPLHTGIGEVVRHGNPDDPITRMVNRARQAMGQTDLEQAGRQFEASFLVPATGNCLIFLRWPGEGRLNRNFGDGLTVVGNSQDGPFRLTCPQYYIKSASPIRERPGWAVAKLTNQAAIVSYGDPRPIASVTAIINNFDFDYGNQGDISDRERDQVLRVKAAGRIVDFAWRSERIHLRRLVDASVMGTTSFVTFSFAAWPGATDEDLTSFADNIAGLCSYVAGQHTGVPVLSFFDADDRLVKRVLRAAVQSKFRSGDALPVMHADDGLPKLFRQSFDEHCRIQQTETWRRLRTLYASIEDPPYLEQKYASLMMAVELLIRSSLTEGGYLSPSEAEAKTLPQLIGLARGKLAWDVPRHYTEGERYRKTRNAVNHGGSLPHDAAQIRADFDKWKLFLLRRLFMKLGFDGQVASPQEGWNSSSPVGEFSEEHNSFGI